MEEALPEIGEDDYEAPRLVWLKYKSLAEMLVAYDTDDGLPDHLERNRADGTLVLHATAMNSRYSVAAEALYHKMDEIKDWRTLAGYLLFDHSNGRVNGVSNDSFSLLKHESVLSEKEEAILLELIGPSVKQTALQLSEKTTSAKVKLNKHQKEQLAEEREENVRHLTNTIPAARWHFNQRSLKLSSCITTLLNLC